LQYRLSLQPWSMPGRWRPPSEHPIGALTTSEGSTTTTLIKHLVVLHQEKASFDHYFGTSSVAANPAGEPHF
jgi:phospholipase C